jgi:methylenetetrahydrofolate reductase (NADPH)
MTTTPELRQYQSQKISQKILAMGERPYYTFEVRLPSHVPLPPPRSHAPYPTQVFPPKTSIGTANLVDRLERMSALDPTWVHVTWGAGGSTQERSLELAGAAQGLGLDTCLHLTCTNMEQKVLDGALEVRFAWVGPGRERGSAD